MELIESIITHNLNRCVVKQYDLDKKYADQLLNNCNQLKNDYEMGGRKIIQFGHNYLYSGLNHVGRELPSFIKDALDGVNNRLQTDFNSVLMNVYTSNKSVGIGKHSDSEHGLEYNPRVASISLGSSDFFNIVSNDPYDEDDSLFLPVNHGTVLLMDRGCQLNYKHYIKPSIRQEDRISLTFRRFE